MASSEKTSSKAPSKLKIALEQHVDTDFSQATQTMLNNPVSTNMSAEDMAFLKDVVGKIEQKVIDLYAPSSLLNKDIYTNLDLITTAKVDLILHNMLSALRTIYSWHKSDGSDANFQMAQMLHEVRMKKESLEKEVGDVLKI